VTRPRLAVLSASSRPMPRRRGGCDKPLHGRRQILDTSLERLVVCFAHHDVDVAGVVVDQHLAQRGAICDRRPGSVSFSFMGKSTSAGIAECAAPAQKVPRPLLLRQLPYCRRTRSSNRHRAAISQSQVQTDSRRRPRTRHVMRKRASLATESTSRREENRHRARFA
jgi:hypothetical protein